MAHLWVKDDGGEWAALPLEGEVYALSEGRPRRVEACADGESCAAVVLVRREGSARGARGGWFVVAEPGARVKVNGRPVSAGLRALSDRDELAVAGVGLFYFSTETLAAVRTFAGAERGGAACPRCKQPLEEGASAVRCPQCGVWHHQTDELPCWTYAEVCALCPQPTALDAQFRWTPEEL